MIGVEPDVIENTVQKLKNQFPGIRIAGYHDGFFEEEEGFERIHPTNYMFLCC